MSDLISLESLFFGALEKEPAAERAVFLDFACAGDAEIRRQVDKLLRAHTRVGGFLNPPAVMQFAGPLNQSAATVGLHAPTDRRNIEDTVLDFFHPAKRPEALGRIGHYEVLDVLGQGGFGIVFRAIDEKLQREVAIKVLAPEFAASPSARQRFLREAQAAASIRHQHVVGIYAVEESPTPYLVMEYIAGQTLQQRLNEQGPLDVPTVLRFGRQIAEGLAAAHAQRLIHRDIKPGNILLETAANDQVKISDFGVVRAADDATEAQHGALAGTPMFMAPEQAAGETLDQRADLFSLGSVLYTMCCGHAPFRGNSTFAVLRRVVEDPARPIREIAPETPPWLCEIITRLHAKNPADRFATASEVAHVLGCHLAQINHPQKATTLAIAEPSTEELVPATAQRKVMPTLREGARLRLQAGRRWAVALTALLLLGGLGFTEANGITDFHATIIRLLSSEGTLVVEVDDPEVSVQIDGEELVIRGAGPREIRLKPGHYTVEARKDGKLVSRELISVTNNGRQVVRVSQESSPPETTPLERTADAAAWERSVAALPAEEQVQAVIARLKELNSGFDGSYQDKRWPEYELFLEGPHLRDISPVRTMPGLKNLYLNGAGVTDLSSLRGLELNILNLSYTGVTDLSPLQDIKLIRLDLSGSAKVENLSPLADTSIEYLTIAYTRVSDLMPLAGLKLKDLNCDSCKVSDLSPLKGMRLASLGIHNTNVFDLSPLSGMPLTSLNCDNSSVSDASLAHLKDCRHLRDLRLLGTKVTAVGIDELSRALPNCRIEWDGGVIEPR